MKTLKDLEVIENKIKELEKELEKLNENAKKRAIEEAKKEDIIITSYCFNDTEREKEMKIVQNLLSLKKEREKTIKELKDKGIIPRRGFIPIK